MCGLFERLILGESDVHGGLPTGAGGLDFLVVIDRGIEDWGVFLPGLV
jgi:hypothetical protein